MVKFNIKYRIFLAILTATAAVVLCMFLIVQWSFNRGFLRYVNTVEQDRLANLAGELEQSFVENGNWDFLRNEPVNWLRLMIRTLPPGTLRPEQLERLERRLERRAERGESLPGRFRRGSIPASSCGSSSSTPTGARSSDRRREPAI